MTEFKDKVVLISGAGGRMGRIAAQMFAREGAKVLGCDGHNRAIEGNDETGEGSWRRDVFAGASRFGQPS
jgi:NAD(P)-dependent dehydrogenase (short-subunit alcohol dehydrogenase family)